VTATVVAPEATAEMDAVRASMRRARRRRRMREAGLAYLMLAPALIVFAVFVFYPFARNFQLAFYRTPPFPGLPKRWAGFSQIHDIVTSHDFRNSVWVTVKFALFTVPIGLFLGILLAVLAHQQLRGMGVYRTIFSSTVASSVAVASVIFFTLLNPQVGLINYYLGRQGGQSFLQDPKWALLMVALVVIWRNLGFTFILMSAGLQAIPDEMFEAARIDGAGAWRTFRRVTMPLLSPVIFFAVVVGTISAWQTFGEIELLTQGGPLQSTNVLTYYVYTSFFQHSNEGQAAVLAISLFTIVLALTLVQLRFLEQRVHYGR
jgi:sn-glycerol 3-phosphate transport system permease protein